MTWRSTRTFGFVAAFVLQSALLAWVVGDRALLLANGQEIRLAVIPVDPRDLLRGDHLVLAYDISRLDAAELDGDDDFAERAPIYVSLAADGDGWRATAIHRAPPDNDELFIAGTVASVLRRSGSCSNDVCGRYRVDYGLERFFVPEGEGIELEALREGQRISVDVAVAARGRAALKRLRVDGEIRFEEPLF